MPSARLYSPQTTDAARLLGAGVRLGRLERRWTLQELADRVGTTTTTLRKVERGDLSVALGTALEAAALVGLPLFDADRERVAADGDRIRARLALLPERVRTGDEPVHDDF